MAINPNTIKALFGKLAPYADDVVEGVANYGDDALALVADKGDDVARAVANYGDDALVVADKVGDVLPFIDTRYVDPTRRGPGLDDVPNLPVDFLHSDADELPRVGANAYGAWDYDFTPPTVDKRDFSGYAKLFDGTSIEYPDGFVTPEAFAKYHDSMELGFIPQEFNPRNSDDLRAKLNAIRQSQLQGSVPPTLGGYIHGTAYPLDYEYYANEILDDEGPLKKFFASQSRLPKRSARLGNMTSNQAFDNPMFMTDWWI